MKYIKYIIYFYCISFSCINAQTLTKLSQFTNNSLKLQNKFLKYKQIGILSVGILLIGIIIWYQRKYILHPVDPESLPPLPPPATPPPSDSESVYLADEQRLLPLSTQGTQIQIKKTVKKIQKKFKEMQAKKLATSSCISISNAVKAPIAPLPINQSEYKRKLQLTIEKKEKEDWNDWIIVSPSSSKSKDLKNHITEILSQIGVDIRTYVPLAVNTSQIVLSQIGMGIKTYLPPAIIGTYKAANNIKCIIGIIIKQGPTIIIVTCDTLDSIKTIINFTRQQLLKIGNTTYNVVSIMNRIIGVIKRQSSEGFSHIVYSPPNSIDNGKLIELTILKKGGNNY